MIRVRRFEFNQVGENTYIVYDETNDAAIIDCGAFYPEEQQQLQEFLKAEGLTLKRLLNTHLHLDHIFGSRFIYETYGILPEYNRKEEILPGLKDQAKAFGITVDDVNLQPTHYIEDGDVITIGNTTFKALLISGHSPGSICFYSEKDHSVFAGDVLFYGSVGRSDLWAGNHLQLISGIKEKLLTLPDDTVVYPGHGPSTTIAHEKKYNMFLQ